MADAGTEEGTLAHHLAYLAATADDVSGYLNQPHGGEIHPEALAKSEHLATSIKDVIHALTEHEHLAMTKDDVWKALTVKHNTRSDGAVS